MRQYCDLSSSGDLDELRRSDPILRRRVENLLAVELERASEIIRKRQDDVERIARTVSERGVVSGAEVAELFGTQGKTG
jgi:ATP-dependent Zn protease